MKSGSLLVTMDLMVVNCYTFSIGLLSKFWRGKCV
jgi:hypothetical protein